MKQDFYDLVTDVMTKVEQGEELNEEEMNIFMTILSVGKETESHEAMEQQMARMEELYNQGIDVFSGESSQEEDKRFLENMEKYKKEKGTKTAFQPIEAEYFEYEVMTPEQREFFFYFRRLAHNGKYLPTADYYIVMYAVELIHQLWGDSLETTQIKLLSLIEHYEDDFFEIKALVFLWSVEFSLLHDLSLEPLLSVEGVGIRAGVIIDALLETANATSAPLTLLLLHSLTQGYIQKSKLAERNEEEILVFTFCLSMNRLDEWLLEEKGCGFLTYFGDAKEEKESIELLTLIPGKETVEKELTLPRYSENPKLLANVKEILRHLENEVRSYISFPGRFKNIKLETEIKDLLSQYAQESLEEYTQHREEFLIETGRKGEMKGKEIEEKDNILYHDFRKE